MVACRGGACKAVTQPTSGFMNAGRRRPARTRPGQSPAVTLPRHESCAAAAGKLVVEGKAERAVVHPDFFARSDRTQRHDGVGAVIAGVRIAGVIEEVDRMAHGVVMKGAAHHIGRRVVAVAQERRAPLGRQCPQLHGRQCGEALPLGLVGPVVLPEQVSSCRDVAQRDQASPARRLAHVEQRFACGARLRQRRFPVRRQGRGTGYVDSGGRLAHVSAPARCGCAESAAC